LGCVPWRCPVIRTQFILFMEVLILSIFSNRPDFIEPQLNSLKKHLKDDFRYMVINNSYFKVDKPNEIKKIAQEQGVGHMRVHHTSYITDPSVLVKNTLNFLWKNFKDYKGILVIMDCDTFLVKDISFNDIMEGYDMAFCPLYTEGKVWPWTGFMLFDMSKLKVDEVSFSFESLDKKKYQDVGSALNNYIVKHNPDLNLLTRTEILYEKDDALESYGFPKPYSVDMVSVNDYKFLFHYKTSSNYAPHCTPEYNEQKTKALWQLLT